MHVKKETLLLLACFIWLAAGFNILRIGILTYTGYVSPGNICISLIVFCIFWFMIFYKLTVKHTARIQGYEEEHHFFLKFFDKKSFLIMAFMMTLGISLRSFHLASDHFIAVFYTGLGSALFLAGIIFGKNYYKYRKTLKTAI